MASETNEYSDRQKICSRLKNLAPKIFKLTFSQDMGYEFSAILSEGVIFGEPGMLISYSEGYLPFDNWDEDSEAEFNKKLEKFCLGIEDFIIPWDQISFEVLTDLWDEVSRE